MRGISVQLSLGRRIVADLVAASDWTTKGVISRRMSLPRVTAARAAQVESTPWAAIVAAAYASVAARTPELRRSYVLLPRPHLYEVPVSVATIAVAREYQGEPFLQFARIRMPDRLGPIATGVELRRLSTTPLMEIPDTRKLLAIAAWPWPTRRMLCWIGLNVGRQRPNFFGTFGITTLAGVGATISAAVNPLTTTLSWSPLSVDSTLEMFCTFDHRVCDGMVIAQALADLEKELEGPTADALAQSRASPAP